jgi:hypothetical protein
MFVSNSIIYHYSVGKKNDGYTNGKCAQKKLPVGNMPME